MSKAHLTGNWLMTATVCSFLFLLLLLLALAPGSLRAQTTSPTVPGAPKYIEGVRQDGRIWVHWGSPYDDGGAVVTGYDLRYIRSDADTTVDGNWTIKLAVSTVAGWDYVMGLTNGVEYHVQVRAVNEVGAGAWSVSFTATPVEHPSPPVINSVTPGEGTLTVSWSAPEDDGGSDITEYRVRHIRSDAPGKPFIAWTEKRGISGSTLQYVIGGLTIGVRYDVQVQATNASGGGSDYSATVTGIPEERTVPSAPAISSVISFNEKLNIVWDAPSDTGGTIITAYDLRYIRSDAPDKADDNWTVLDSIWTSGTRAYGLGGLTNWVGYDVQVRAENSEGTGPWSATTTGTPGNLPSAPTIVKLFDIPGYFQVDWSAPADNGGAAIIDYYIRLTRGAGTRVYDDFWEPGDPLAQGFEAPGSSTEFGVEVRAVNPAGPGPWSAMVTFTTGSISAPVMVAGSPGDGQILVTWQAPDKGADGITTYDLRYIRSDADKSVGANWFLGEGKWSSGPLQYTITGLDNGVEYDVQVRAVRGLVRGPWSASTTATLGTTLASPTINSLTPGDGALVVAWSAPANSGDASITGYDLRYIRSDESNKADANWTVKAGIWSSGALRYDLAGLTNGVGYEVQVRGVNSVGAGAWSASGIEKPRTTPEAPSINSLTPGEGTLAVAWSAPGDDGGADITSYGLRYIRSDAPDKADANWTEEQDAGSSASLEYTITGLTNGVEYAVRVIAVNDVGDGPPSDEATATPRETTPPELSTATVDGATLTLTYDEALDENSEPSPDAFSVTVGGTGQAVDGVAVEGDTVTLTLASAVTAEETVTVSYAAPADTAALRIRDLAGNAAASFSDELVTNNTPKPNSPATGQPTITGTAQVGETLAADISGIGDDDGLPAESEFDYQWIRNDGSTDANIAGGTDSTYVLLAADVGKFIKVQVTFTDKNDYPETLTSAATAAVDPDPGPITGFTVVDASDQSVEGALADGGTLALDDPDGGSFGIRADLESGATIGSMSLELTGEKTHDQTENITPYSLYGDSGGNLSGESLPVGEYTLTATAHSEARLGGNVLGTLEVSFTVTETATQQPNTPATGLPSIGGTAQVGETLTVDTSGIDDADGIGNATFSYQWIAGTTDISGATGSSYAPLVADLGKTIKVRVSFDDDQNNFESLTSAATAAVAAKPNTPATGAPTISGTAQVGKTLTASTSDIADADGLSGAVFSYQWLANGADIAGATDPTYTLVADDLGKTIKVRVSFTDDDDNGETLTSAATAAVAPKPNSPATGEPTIGGTAQVGETLTASTTGIADADGLTNATFSYQWIASDGNIDTDISGATGDSYTSVAADEGKAIKVRVSFTDDRNFQETLTSEATATVTAAVTPLTAGFQDAPDSHDGTSAFTFEIAFSEDVGISYKTLRDDSLEVTNGSATKAKRVNGQSDLWEITVEPDSDADVTVVLPITEDCGAQGAVCTRAGGNERRPLSNRSELTVPGPAAANSPATGAPSISGTAQVGETLTVDTSGIDDVDGMSGAVFSYQWIADGVDIAGATGDTYTLVEADVGKAVKVRVIFNDDDHNEETLTSAPTVAVAPKPNKPAAGAPTISGTVRVGEVLTAHTSDIADADGMDNAEFSFNWGAGDYLRVTGVNETYRVQSRDVGLTIRVAASFTDDAGNLESLLSANTVAVAPTTPAPPQRLNVSHHGTGALDLSWEAPTSELIGEIDGKGTHGDGGSPITGYRVQWKESTGRWDVPADVSEETVTGTTHTITGLTDGVEYAVRVIATNVVGNGLPSGEATGTPRETTPPELATAAVNGVILTLTYDEALEEGSEPASDAFSVTVGGTGRAVDEVSVSSSSVILTLGSAVTASDTVTVSYTVPADTAAPRIQDEAGNPAASFSDQDVENNTPPPANTPVTGAPTISGTAQVGETLTAETSAIADADGMSGAVFIYQWLANGADITGATSSNYTLVDADAGQTIKVKVSFFDDKNNRETLTSEPTAAVEPRPNSPATGAPSISGTVRVGETLTAETRDIEDDDGLSKAVFTYQWLANDADIAGATSDTYTPVADDVGKAIQVKVSFRDDRNHQESLTSAATAAVTATADDSAVWSATLTVGSIAGYRGFWKDVGMGELTSEVFTLDGVDYTVKVLADSDGPQFYLTLDKALPVGFTLQVGATTLSSQDASIREFSSGATQYGWATNQGAILADVDTVEVSLTLAD